MSMPPLLDLAVDEVLATLPDRLHYSTMQARNIARALRAPGALPDELHTAAALDMLVLADQAPRARDLALGLLRGTPDDVRLVSPLVLAHLECGDAAAGAALESRLDEFQGGGARQIFTAKAVLLAEEFRYAEAADYLQLDHQLPLWLTATAPRYARHRLETWAAVHCHASIPALDPATGQLELPDAQRQRALQMFPREMSRLLNCVVGVPMLQGGLVVELGEWLDAPRGEDIRNTPALVGLVQAASQLLLDAVARE